MIKRTKQLLFAFILVFAIGINSQALWQGADVITLESEVSLDQLQKVDKEKRDLKPKVTYDKGPEMERKQRPIPEVEYRKKQEPVEKEEKEVKKEKKLELKEMQVIEINKSLKNVIEENMQLRDKADQLDEQLRNLRGQRNIELNRMNTLKIERDSYKKQSEEVSAVKERVLEFVDEREKEIKQRETFLAGKIKELEEELTKKEEKKQKIEEETNKMSVHVQKLAQDQTKSKELLDMLKVLDEGKRKIRSDKAKVHYNMGNTYFQDRQYKKAIVEYRMAIKIMPEDAYSHFNLAFVSGEYMYDHKTAVKHYQKYLILNPKAEDADLVREKMLSAELILRSSINSSLETDLQRDKSEIFRDQ